jgi:hypothetical protein
MPKLNVPRESFGELDVYTNKLSLRFRIVSEDKNKSSYWSPVFQIDPEVEFIQGTFAIPGTAVGEKTTGRVALAWDSVGVYHSSTSEYNFLADLPYYDIWIQFGSNNMTNAGSWIYKTRIATESITIIVPSLYTYNDTNGVSQTAIPRQMKIEVHRPARPITRYSPNRVVFTQDTAHVSIIDNTITFDKNHEFITGTHVGYYLYNAASAISPLTDGGDYWIRAVSDTVISLHNSLSDATNNLNKIDFTSAGQGGGVFVKNPYPQNSTTINLTTNIMTIDFDHGFKTGSSVIYNAATAAGGLTKETLYWLRAITSRSFSLHTSRVGSINNSNIVDITSVGNGYATLAYLPTLLYKINVAV